VDINLWLPTVRWKALAAADLPPEGGSHKKQIHKKQIVAI
jgi:hypothetical protein